MHRFQFRLSSLLLFVPAIGAAVLIGVQWLSVGAQQTIETALLIVFFSSLFLSYTNSSASGATRAFRAASITSTLWCVLVFATHIMFTRSMEMHGFRLSSVITRACIVGGIGTALAFLTANGMFLGKAAWRVLPLSVVRKLTYCVGALLALGIAFFGIWMVSEFAGYPKWPSTVANQIEQRKLESQNQQSQNSDVRVLRRTEVPYLQSSPNGRWAVRVDGAILRVFDMNTSELLVELPAHSDGWFLSAAFVPDSRTLVAVRTTSWIVMLVKCVARRVGTGVGRHVLIHRAHVLSRNLTGGG